MIVGTLPIGLAARSSAGLLAQSTSTCSYSAPASWSAQRAIWPRLIGLVKKVYSAISRAPDQAEGGALRVDAMDDPVAARNLMRAAGHLSAGVLDPRLRRSNAVHPEVVIPVRLGRVGQRAHDR